MRMDKATQSELKAYKEGLGELMPRLSKHGLEQIQTLVSAYYMKAWKHRKTPKYGDIQKGFKQDELDRFFSVITDDRFKLLFEYQAYLALRIGEAVALNMKDFNFEIRELKVKTEKAHTLDTLKIPDFLFIQTLEYAEKHKREIEGSQGYLFYPEEHGHSDMPHITMHHARKVFRDYTQLAGLTEIYDTSEETQADRPKRNLFRLTTHSLRHYGITRFNRAVHGDIILTQKYARHTEISSTQTYIYTSKDELYSAIDTAFSKGQTTKELKVLV